MNQPNDPFNAWLIDRDIDCQALTPELRAALVAQWANQQAGSQFGNFSATSPETVIVVADDECWPFAERVPSF